MKLVVFQGQGFNTLESGFEAIQAYKRSIFNQLETPSG